MRAIVRITRPSIVSARRRASAKFGSTWREFDAYVNRWANALATLGVARGDRVATVLANSLELLATYWACAKLGAAVVPLSPLLTATGLASLLADAPPKVVLASRTSSRCSTRCARASAFAPAWVLIDAAADDEAAGYRAFGLLHAERERQRAGRARRGGRSR